MRRQGYAFAKDQVLLGQIGIGRVVCDAKRRPIAAINIVLSSDEWSDEQVKEELVPLLFKLTSAITGP